MNSQTEVIGNDIEWLKDQTYTVSAQVKQSSRKSWNHVCVYHCPEMDRPSVALPAKTINDSSPQSVPSIKI